MTTTRDTAGGPLLLRAASQAVTLTPRSLDVQVRVGRPVQPSGADGAVPCVLVLTRTADREIDDLSLRLTAEGVVLLRLDSDRCAGLALEWHPSTGVVVTDEGAFAPRVRWLRYFAPEAVGAGRDDVAGGSVLARYLADQWAALAPALGAGGGGRAAQLNQGTGPGAPDRLRQLDAARAVGLRVPATVVTTQPAEAGRHLPGPGDVVVKALGPHAVEHRPGCLRGVFPRRLPRRELAACAPEPAPVLVQEHVAAPRELRVFLVGRRLVAYAVEKPSVDAEWDRPRDVRIHRAGRLPRRLAGALRRLGRRFGLDVAAFDLLDAEGGPVFLEVNSACDWVWFEQVAGDRAVSDAVAALVLDRYRRS